MSQGTRLRKKLPATVPPPPDTHMMPDDNAKNKSNIPTGTPGNLSPNERSHLFVTAVVPFVFVPLLFVFVHFWLIVPSMEKRSLQIEKSTPPEVGDQVYEQLPETITLMTKEELATYNGVDNPQRYLAVLGEVYDVSLGKFYMPGGGYDFYVGKDASRGFATGKDEEEPEEVFLNMSASEIHGIVGWTVFYRSHNDYDLVAKLIGLYFDSNGKSTKLRDNIFEIYEKEQQKINIEAMIKKEYPNCSRKWTLDAGTILYCKQDETLEKIDIQHHHKYADKTPKFVPRDLFSDLRQGMRCVCVDLDEALGDTETFRLFDKCMPQNVECSIGLRKKP